MRCSGSPSTRLRDEEPENPENVLLELTGMMERDGGLEVGFGDGHVITVSKESEFKRLLKFSPEARAALDAGQSTP